MRDLVLERNRIESDLRQAIAGDELTLHYQPKLNASTLECVGVEALAQIGRLAGGRSMDEATPSARLAAALRRAIDQHYKEDGPVSRYVELLATTPHLLDKAARETFGQSVKDMLMERRVLEAKRLLMFTIRPVEDIGREIGFQDPAYFSRFFRKRTGHSPADWRRQQLQS